MSTEIDIAPGKTWSSRFDGDGSTAQEVIAICTTPRTGSHFLCEILYKMGQGVPFEYYMEKSFDLYRERFARQPTGDFLEEYTKSLLKLRTQNNIFSFKLNYQQLGYVRWRLLKGLPKTFIWLRRRNLQEQAVSFCAARQTGKWGPGEDVTVELPQSGKPEHSRYADAVRFLRQSDESWKGFFESNRVVPCTLWYEEIVSAEHTEAALSRLPVKVDPMILKEVLAGSTAYQTNTVEKEQLRQALSGLPVI